jgi:MFS family permease
MKKADSNISSSINRLKHFVLILLFALPISYIQIVSLLFLIQFFNSKINGFNGYFASALIAAFSLSSIIGGYITKKSKRKVIGWAFILSGVLSAIFWIWFVKTQDGKL